MTTAWRDRGRERIGRVTNRQLVRSIWLGTVIGLVSGLGAITFAWGIGFVTEHLLGTLAGYTPAQPLGEGDGIGSGPDRRWALPFVLALGGLISGALVFTLAPEAEGHGTDAAIAAYHRRGGRTRVRVIPVKLIASAITIGSGGAAGREGPTAQIGGGFGSWVADRFHLEAAERRRALAAGMGSGVGAIFRAPLGGALMAAEVLYKHDFEAEVLLLGLIASIVAYSVFGLWAGWDPMFGGGEAFTFSHASELPYYAVLGLLCGVFGLLYAKVFYRTVDGFARLAIPRLLKPALGGLAVGVIGMFAPEAIYVGYGTVQKMMTVNGITQFSPWLLLLLPMLRIVTTSLSVGSGGSGGIFGPGMVIGAVLGGFAWRFGHDLPGFPREPGPVVIICMIAAFGSIAHVPLAMLLMVGEMTGNLSLLAPAMVAVAIATLVVGDTSIYERQVPTRADSPVHRHRFAFPLLSTLPLSQATRPAPLVPASTTVADAARSIGDERIVLVSKNDGGLAGVTAERVLAAASEGVDTTVGELAQAAPETLNAEMPFDEALDRLAASGVSWLPVVDKVSGRPLGVIDARALMRSYREAATSAQGRHPGRLTTFETVISERSRALDCSLSSLEFPAGSRVVSIVRSDTVIVPDGSTTLQPGDLVTTAVSSHSKQQAIQALLGP